MGPVTFERERLRDTLSKSGIAADAPVDQTLGRTHALAEFRSRAQARASTEKAPFVLRAELGRGGMATVWSAEQTALAREVAVKRATDPDDRDAELCLLREAIVAARLEHPNIVPIHQLIVDERGPLVVMKRIAGKTWDMLIEDPLVTLETHLEVLLQTMNAVGFAHSRSVFHRDIKPQNVMIGDYGEVYLLDWGVAKHMLDPASTTIVGTPCYMAPEMADGLADERTDVFLLGATLHEVLTGVPRHEGESALDVLYAAMYVEPYAYPASVPGELAEICNRACARAPEARFANVAALREAVLRYREHRSANLLTDAALSLLAQLHGELGVEQGGAHGYSQIQRRFGETRFAFEAALRVWPESPSALAGHASCLALMIDYELGERHLAAAEALFAMLPRPDDALRTKLAGLRAELELERTRLRGIERDRDPSVGALGRTRAYLGMGAATGLMTLALYARRMLLPEQPLSSLRLSLIGGLVLAIMVGVALLWRRYGDFNLINHRIAQISIATLAISFASRLSGYLSDTAAERTLTNDAFILALGGMALAPYHQAGPWLATMSLTVAAVGTLYPGVVDELFIALSVLVPVALILLKRDKLRTMASERRGARAARQSRAKAAPHPDG
jgi:eukaryotic-like serine/threonine-protein kinase